MISDDPGAYARTMMALACVGVLISCAEMLSGRRELSSDGFFDWEVLRTSYARSVGPRTLRVLDGLFAYPQVLGVIGLQGLAACLLLVEPVPGHRPLLITVILVTRLFLYWRNQYGLDGADQMLTIVLAGGLVFYAAPSEAAQRAGLLFVAAQAALAYFTSGYVKWISPTWRGGDALRGIVNTKSYGHESFARLLTRRRWLSSVGCWLTIAFECLGPFAVLLGPGACLVFLAGGIMFHVGIAVSMGLNNFLWSFLATYPALLYASTVLSLRQLI